MANILKATAITSVIGVALYAFIGYAGVPYITKNILERHLAAQIHRPISVGKISFNPWTWSFELQNLHIQSREGDGDILSLGSLRIDASAQTLLKFAPVLNEVTVDGLHGHFTIYDKTLKEVSQVTGSQTSEASSSKESSLPAFAIYNISVINSSLRVVDKVHGLDESITDFNLTLPFVSTLESAHESLVTPALSFKFNGTPIVATGTTKPFGATLEAQLNAKVSNLDIAPLMRLVPALNNSPLTLTKAKLSTDLTFTFQNPNAGLPAKMLLSGTSSLSDVALMSGRGNAQKEVMSLKNAAVSIKNIDLVDSIANIQSVTIDTFNANLTHTKDGLNGIPLTTAVSADKAGHSPSDTKNASWKWDIDNISLKNTSLSWHDTTVKPAVNTKISHFSANIKNLSSDNRTKGTYTLSANALNGSVSSNGTVAMSPTNISASLAADKISLTPVAGYIKEATGLDISAVLGLNVKAAISPATMNLSGTLQVSSAKAIQNNIALGEFSSLNVNLKKLDLAKQIAEVESVSLKGAKINAVKNKNGLNLTNLNVNNTESTTPYAASATSRPWQWAVNSLSVSDSSLHFKDNSVSPAASASLTKLNVNLKGLSSAHNAKAHLNASAGLGGGNLSATGEIILDPMTTALSLDAKGIELKSFSNLMLAYANVGAKSGTFNSHGNLSIKNTATSPLIGWKGDMSLSNFDMVNAKGHDLMNWTKASLTGMDIETSDPIKIAITRAEIDQPAAKQVEKVAGIASVIAGLRGNSKALQKIDKITDKLSGSIVLENVRYVNGRFSANGVSASSVAGILLDKLSHEMGDKLGGATNASSNATK